jgi:hypothetical protein
LKFRLHYDAETELSNVTVGVGIIGILGDPLALCSTRLTGQELDRVPRRGVFVCAIQQLPLVPDRYSPHVYVQINGATADWVQDAHDAHAFDVTESDVFGSGKLPPKTHARFLLEHSWSVANEELVGTNVA